MREPYPWEVRRGAQAPEPVVPEPAPAPEPEPVVVEPVVYDVEADEEDYDDEEI